MIKVLVADDQELIRQSLRIILSSKKNFEVTDTVENGQEVIKSVRKNSPDVVLIYWSKKTRQKSGLKIMNLIEYKKGKKAG